MRRLKHNLKDFLDLSNEVIIELYDRLPGGILFITEPLIKSFKTVLSFLSDLRVNALFLHFEFQERNDPLKILFIGKKNQIKFLRGLIGIDNCTLYKKSCLFFWQINHYLKNPNLKTDLIIINVNKILFFYLRHAGFLRIPDGVKSVLNLCGSFEDIKKKFHQNVSRANRKIMKSNYAYKVFHDESALQYFYYEMYTPYIKRRFNELTVIKSYYKAKRLLKTGFLLIILKEDYYVSGAICRIRKDQFTLELLGIEKGSLQLLRECALDALYYFSIVVALEKNCRTIDFGNSRPFLNDGLVRYKRRWGSTLIHNQKQCREIGIRVNGSNTSGYHFLLNNYPVFFEKKGLSGLILSDKTDPIDFKYMKHLENAYYTPGLNRLVIVSSSGFDKKTKEHYRSYSTDRVKLVNMDSKDFDINKILKV